MVACGPAERARTSQPALPSHAAPRRGADPALEARVRDAERALDTSFALDYNRPFEPRAEPPAEAMLLEACREGAARACWLALGVSVAGTERWREALRLVAEHCRAGHGMSCRALPLDHEYGNEETFADLPGAAGRTAPCHRRPAATDCQLDALRAECRAGFAASCLALARTPGEVDRAELAIQAAAHALEGCREGIVRDCQSYVYARTGDADANLTAYEHICRLSGRDCTWLAQELLQRGDRGAAREHYEQSCQYGVEQLPLTCLELARDYLAGRLDEPVAGRGQALLGWACGEIRRKAGADMLIQYRDCQGTAATAPTNR
jgi:hypothetical protein